MKKKQGTTPTFSFMLSNPWHLISLGFGSGLSPIVPGTVGTAFGVLSFHFLTAWFPTFLTPLAWYIICAIGFVIGIKACQFTGDALMSPDSGHMVWDEIIAMWLIMAYIMPTDWKQELAAFVLFRIFDMTKPPPIRWFDRHIHGGFGVMLDDIIAAIFAIISFVLCEKMIAIYA
jgi:phosphatidylglycerophosphatase A